MKKPVSFSKIITELLIPPAFLWLTMALLSATALMLVREITGVSWKETGDVSAHFRFLPLLVSLGAAIIAFLVLYPRYRRDDLRFGKDRILPGHLAHEKIILLLEVLLFFATAGILWSMLIVISGWMRLFPYYSEVASQAFMQQNPLFLLASTGFIIPVAEELVFRGLVYRRARFLIGEKAAIFLSALLFGIYHANMVQFLYAAGMGILLALLYEKSKSLWMVILAHMGSNIWTIASDQILRLPALGSERGQLFFLLLQLAVFFFTAAELWRRLFRKSSGRTLVDDKTF